MDLRQSIKTKMKKWHIIVIFEVVVIVFLSITIILQAYRKDSVVDVSLSDWKSTRYFSYDEDGWYIDETMLKMDDGKKPVRLYGPYISLDQGTYSVSIEYECEYDQSCEIYANDIKDAYVNGRGGRLSKNYKKTSYEFMLTEGIDNFEFIVDYNRTGCLRVKDIEIRHNTAGFRMILTVFIFLSLAINVLLFFKRKRKVLIEIYGIILLVSLPLFIKGVYAGHDSIFHLMRIESIADELQRGTFPIKVSSLWMDGYGYPVSVYYGDFLLYTAAVFA